MITPSQNRDGALQVSRLVGGGERFLAVAADDCLHILKRRLVTTLTELKFTGESGELEPTYASRNIETDNFEVSRKNELELILLHRGVSRNLAGYYRTKKTADDLSEYGPDQIEVQSDGVDEDRDEADEQTKDVLKAGCMRIAAEHGQKFDHVSLPFDRIAKLSTPGDDIIYGLLPERDHPVTKATEAMAKLALRSLDYVNEPLFKMPAVCGIDAPHGITVPFARIPGKTSSQDQRDLVQLWQSHLPKETPLTLFLSDLITVGR
jgi:hypothetical protein